MASFLKRSSDAEVPVKVLGGGANVLIRDDGYDGVVIRLDQPAFKKAKRIGNDLEVGAGVDLMPLCKHCSDKGMAGLESLAGIPATVGGAVRMNAGGHAGEFGDLVKEVDVIGRDGAPETISRDQVGFGYRHSEIDDRIVIRARLALRDEDPIQTRRRYTEHFETKRRSQPLAERSAGCVFKNPPGQAAGALIDRAGLKGTTCGGARVSERHANFIVADRSATASDVVRLIDVVRTKVADAFGTDLETEIDIW